jgi:hypothetical protein
MQQTQQQPLFSLGQIVATPGALAALEKAGQSPTEFLSPLYKVSADNGMPAQEPESVL